MSVSSIANAEHYAWGDNCQGWHLAKSDKLSVIEERIPSGSQEQRHYHRVSEQYFYVLEGEATIEVAGAMHRLKARQGLHIPANVPHQVVNQSEKELQLLVISTPPSHDDRVETQAVVG